jgi:hypothetical protein
MISLILVNDAKVTGRAVNSVKQKRFGPITNKKA